MDLDAIRARDAMTFAAAGMGIAQPTECAQDRRALLAEVDRLREGCLDEVHRVSTAAWENGEAMERARALPVIEAARALLTEVTRGDDCHPGAEVVAAAALRAALAEYDR